MAVSAVTGTQPPVAAPSPCLRLFIEHLLCWPHVLHTLQLDALEVKLCQLLGRSLHVDDSTAKFYLDEANGDVKAAMEAFGECEGAAAAAAAAPSY